MQIEADLQASEQTLVIKLGYQGAAFSGYAEQPGQRTVAGELRRALETVLHREVDLTCAGRTDAGVHAISQYVSLPVYKEELTLRARKLLLSLNALMSDDTTVYELYRANQGFSARFDAVMRHYTYRIFAHPYRPVQTWGRTWWYRGTLDVAAMHDAAQVLVGEHDFKSFCKTISAIGKPTHRYIDALSVTHTCEMGEDLIQINVDGNAFLHSMVRTITGTLVEVGRGHRDKKWVQEGLEACDRSKVGPCAPAQGLTFVGVDYPEASLTPWDQS